MTNKKFVTFVILTTIIINIFLTLFSIQSIPPVVTYDELYYATEARSILVNRSNSAGDWKPWFFAPAHAMYSELTGTTLTPFFALISDNLLAMKTASCFLGLVIIVCLGLINLKLTGNKLIFLATLIVSTLNPWLFQFTRMGFDSLFSVAFYLLGVTIILYLNHWKKTLATIPLTLGFFQYQGHKVLLVPLMLLVAGWLIFLKRSTVPIGCKDSVSETKKSPLKNSIKTNLPLLVLLFFSILLTIVYLVRLPKLSSSIRISEYSLLSNPQIAQHVDHLRKLSINNTLNSLFFNKVTAAIFFLTDRYLKSFNPTTLFVKGNQAVDTFAVTQYGFFHLIDFVLLTLGLCLLIIKKKLKPVVIFPIIMILIGAIPNAIRVGSSWLTFRGAFLIMGLILLIGIILGTCAEIAAQLLITKVAHISYSAKEKAKVAIYCSFFICYGLLSLSFFHLYFCHYPVSATTNNYFYERVLTSYIKRQPENKFHVVADSPMMSFDMLGFYNSLYDQENFSQITEAHQTKNYQINNVTYTGRCQFDEVVKEVDSSTMEINQIEPEKNSQATIIIDYRKEPCQLENVTEYSSSPEIEISSLVDSGTKFRIINDQLCHQFDLPRYSHLTSNKLHVEKLSDQEFCQLFFRKL